MHLLDIQNLSISYYTGEQTVPVLKNFSCTIDKGEMVAVMGASGVGKTTAILSVLGLLPPRAKITSGTILFQGEDITWKEPTKQYKKKMQQIRGKQIAIAFQDPQSALNPVEKIGYQMQEAMQSHQKISKKEARAQSAALLLQLGLKNPDWVLKQIPDALSGGMKQRAMLAISLCQNPSLFIADEPSSALDAITKKQMLEVLLKVAKERKTAILMVTHDKQAAAKCDRIVTVLHQDSIKSIESTGKSVCQANIGSKPILQLSHITKTFSERSFFRKDKDEPAVYDATFSIHQGEFFGLIGESGSGKTTLARIVQGFIKPDAGQIFFQGKEMHCLRERMGKIQMVFQNPYSSLNPAMTVGRILSEPYILQKKGTKEENQRKIASMLERVALPADSLRRYPKEFSGGQRQRIALARALLMEPSLLICDEVLAALDGNSQKNIVELLQDVQKKEKIACLFISHHMHWTKALCQRAAVLYHGRIVEMGNTKDLFYNPSHVYTQQLIFESK